MRRLFSVLVFLLAMTAAIPVAAQERVTTEDLDLRPRNHEGEEVIITGELIGDYGYRGDYVWVQLNDDAYVTKPLAESGEPVGTNTGIGIRVPRPLVEESWGPLGRYRTRGPIVTITGIFRYNDPATGGETFIDVTDIDLAEPARPIDPGQPDPAITVTGIVLLVLGSGAFAYVRWWRERPS